MLLYEVKIKIEFKTKIMNLNAKQLELKEKIWSEVKGLEQEYNRGEKKIKELRESQSEISSRIQILLLKLQKQIK